MIISLFLTSCSNSISDNKKNSDLDIFTIDGHPVYYGTVEQAEKIWTDFLGETVILPNSGYKYQDEKTLIVFTGYGSNFKLLNDIQLYFKNTKSGCLNLSTALKIAYEYLPIDLMHNYYEFVRSYILDDIDPTETNTYMYVIHYTITENGLNQREKTQQDGYYTMPYEIFVKLYSSDNSQNIDILSISDDLDNAYWDIYYTRKGLKETKWNYDFLAPDGVPTTTTEPSVTKVLTELTSQIEQVETARNLFE